MTQQSDLGTLQPFTALPNSGTPRVINGVTTLAQSADVQAAFSGTTITPSKSFTFPWRGSYLNFRAGQSAHVEADLLAALSAASAPYTTP
jgi:hypothetical protein